MCRAAPAHPLVPTPLARPRHVLLHPPCARHRDCGGGGGDATATLPAPLASLREAANRTASRLLPGPLRFAPSLYLPAAGALSLAGALTAPSLVARAAAALPPALVAALPASAAVASFYAAHAPACDAALATLAGLIGVAAGFVVLPALDVALGEEREEEMAGDDASYRAWLYASGAFHIALVAAGVAAAPMLAAAPLTAVTLSVGLSGGLAFTVAHELIHGRAPPDRAAAAALLAVACYGHWRDAHLAHHKNVGTFADPATARLGESLFAFIPRSVLGGVADGLAADRARVAARGWTASRVPLWVAAPAAGVAAAAAWGGGASVAFFLGQAAMGVFMLETVNYIEHYGLERRLVATGDGTRAYPERVAPHHSWNANTLATNAVSFRLQRHSDHHAHAERPFHRLRDARDAPQLPAGYSALMLAAAFAPGLFRRVMDPRVAQERARAAAKAE